MKSRTIYEQLNKNITAHQKLAKEWKYNDAVKNLTVWINRFILEFKLKVPSPCLAIDKKSNKVTGLYRMEINAIGAKHEILINARYLQSVAFSRVLEILLHELLHLWQHMHGRPGKYSYHNNEYRKKAVECGIALDMQGHSTGIIEGSVFEKLLRKHRVNMSTFYRYNPGNPVPVTAEISGLPQKLRKWSCGCQNVRVGKKKFEAVCLLCGNKFK